MIASDQMGSDANSDCDGEDRGEYVGEGDLGDFKFDDDAAKELGRQIVGYSQVIQELIRDLKGMKAFPGLRCASIRDESGNAEDDKVFVFRGTDFIKYIRKETNEIKHLLYAYKIYV